LNQEQVRIPSGELANVYYEIRAPDDSALQGTYWSLILVEPVAGKNLIGRPLRNLPHRAGQCGADSRKTPATVAAV
jgi:hypothetical protein